MGVIPGNSHPVADSSLSIAQINALAGVTEQSALQAATSRMLPGFMQANRGLFGWIGDLTSGIMGVIGGVAGAVLPTWLPAPIRETAVQVRDGQIGLRNEAELLKGVRGYCASYQTKNVNIEWSLDKYRNLPFNGKVLDNPKGAHIEGNGITFDETGLWIVYVYARARATSFGGGDGIALIVDVNFANGNNYSQIVFDEAPGVSYATIGGAFPVLISEAGQRVTATAWSDKWRWWDGGMKYARMAVVKVDSSPTGSVPDTVPDETKPATQTARAMIARARIVDNDGVATYHDPETSTNEDAAANTDDSDNLKED